MPARNTLNNKLAATTLVVVIATEMLWGCASTSHFSDHSQYLHPLSAVSLVQNGLGLAVWLEDQCESQETDERNLTLLEALHDGLILPTEMLFAITVVTIVSTVWSLYDRIMLPTGEPLPNRPQLVMEYVKPHRLVHSLIVRSPMERIFRSHGRVVCRPPEMAETSYYPEFSGMGNCSACAAQIQSKRTEGGHHE
ncbi:MAG TPA: hypothetical protein VK901_06685 [Nitrospiraceae bacterium]|nr:hypothetical protein [Nitrospiraceae bacterium]